MRNLSWFCLYAVDNTNKIRLCVNHFEENCTKHTWTPIYIQWIWIISNIMYNCNCNCTTKILYNNNKMNKMQIKLNYVTSFTAIEFRSFTPNDETICYWTKKKLSECRSCVSIFIFCCHGCCCFLFFIVVLTNNEIHMWAINHWTREKYLFESLNVRKRWTQITKRKEKYKL